MAGLYFCPIYDCVFQGLEWGLSRPLRVRREIVKASSEGRLLYASDIHLRPSNQKQIVSELLQMVEREQPGTVLLGGDLVDQRSSLECLTELVSSFGQTARVAAVCGNHDRIVGYDRVREAGLAGGGVWLADGAVRWGGIELLERVEQYSGTGFAALCSHYPTDFTGALRKGIRLVLAGHLHGWQVVLWERGEYLYPGAWLSRWNGLRFEREASTLLVSRGVTDLFPLRWNCPREVILVEFSG